MMGSPAAQIDPVIGVVGTLDVAGFPGPREVAAVPALLVVVVARSEPDAAPHRAPAVGGDPS